MDVGFVPTAPQVGRLIEELNKLPGIGPKTAQRLTFYLLHVPQSELDDFAGSLSNLKKQTVLCSICKNVSEKDPCDICTDGTRDLHTVMVVEEPLDILAIEKAGRYTGIYHVLHGSINPLENIGPDELYIADLLNRFGNGNPDISEVIIATNPTMEGEATAMYISKKIKGLTINNKSLIISRLGMGMPTGADLEYTDELTLRQAIEGRREI